MQRFVKFTLRQRVVMNLLFVLLMVVGAFTLLRMPVERYPNIQFGKMYVNTYLPGASPEEVEIRVTRKIEEGLEGVEDVEFIRSSSYRERSSIVIKFEDDSDYSRRFDDVRLKVLSIVGDLPENTEPPVFNFLDVGDWFPAVSVNVAGNHSNTTLTQVAEELKIPLAQLDGVKEVKLTGSYTREFHVLLSEERMRAAGTTFMEVAAALRSANITIPAGHARVSDGELVVRVDEQFSGREDLFDAVIRRDSDGSLLRVGDVAETGYLAYRDPFIMASVNGEDCVTLQILKTAGSNALFIVDNVRELIDELRPVYSAYNIILTVTQDSSTKIKDSIRVLGVNLLLGIILVCAIISLFMGFRNAALTTVGIPFAFLVTMVLMYVTGNSINEVSLFAFVLVSGIIVDDAIVVVENIYRHLQTGKSLTSSITDGTAEVFLPVVSATLTTMVAFLPMLIMSGMVGDFFAIIPKTIVFALVASLLECLLILPCHYMDFGPRPKMIDGSDEEVSKIEVNHSYAVAREGRLMTLIRSLFHRCILLALSFRRSAVLLLAILFISAMGIFLLSVGGKSNLVRIQFFPDDYSLYYAEITGPPGTPLTVTHQLVKQLAEKVLAGGEGQAESALGFAGYYINEEFSPQYGNNLGYVAVTLPAKADRRFDDYPENDVAAHLEQVRKTLSSLVGEGISLSVRPEKDGPPSGKDINIRVLGSNSRNVAALAVKLEGFLKNNEELAPWLIGLHDDQGSQARVFRIKIDSQLAAENGYTVAEVALLAASAIDGQLVGEMELPEETVDIRLKTGSDSKTPMVDVLDMVLRDTADGTLRLGDLCTQEYSLEPGYLNRFQSQRAITLTANLQPGGPVTSSMVVDRVSKYYAKIRAMYPGAGLNFAGEYESTQKSFSSLAYAFVIAIVVIYLILAAQFKSYLQPMIIIAAVVFALTGVIFGTVLSRTLFTINSFVAVIGVTGVVVNDSLVLVEFINRCYLEMESRNEALLRATHIRLRPILLTTLTTTLGLLPMALGIPEYSLIWGSMAMTFVTGLCSATFLTIIIIPLLWDMVTDKGRKTDSASHLQ